MPRLKAAVTIRNFNPRTRVGCDVTFPDDFDGPIIISIHAPGWGATK